MYLLYSFLIVAVEDSTHYVEAAVVTLIGVPLLAYATGLPGLGPSRTVEQWAGGRELDRAKALDATYASTGGAVVRTVASQAVWASVFSVVVGAIAGASWSRVLQYGIVGAAAFGLVP